MTEAVPAAPASVANLTERAQKQTFQSIWSFQESQKSEYFPKKIPQDQIDQWVRTQVDALKVTTGGDLKVTLICTYPEKVDVAVPCLAIATYPDRIEVLTLEGSSCKLHPEEVRP